MAEVIIMPAMFATVAFIVWVLVSGVQRRNHLRMVADFNSKLLQRISSLEDFGQFLETDAGARFVNSLSVQYQPPSRAHDGILRSVQAGVVLFMLGVGFLLSARYGGFIEYEPLIILGTVAVSLGVGFVLSAMVSYRLARSLGVLGSEPSSGRLDRGGPGMS